MNHKAELRTILEMIPSNFNPNDGVWENGIDIALSQIQAWHEKEIEEFTEALKEKYTEIYDLKQEIARLAKLLKMQQELTAESNRDRKAWALSKLEEVKNPYPESIFIPPTDKQYEELHKALQKVGLTLDKFSGDLGRRVFKHIIDDTRKALND